MRTKLLIFLSLCLAAGKTVSAPLGTAFTYQGSLSGGGASSTGTFDFQFSLFDAASNGSQVGSTLTNLSVPVNNGLFTVTLDFSNVFSGDARWLALGVRTSGSTGAFTALTPLQMLTPTPYALYATGSGSGGGGGSIAAGSITPVQLDTTGTAPAPGQVLAYNGTGLVWTNPPGGGGGADGNGWSLTGNSGTTPGVNFLGTTDDNTLQFEVDGVRGWQMQPTGDSPSLVGGAPGNFIAGGTIGATIAGGGTITLYGAPYTNSVFADHGTIGGGLGNTIQTGSYEAIIAGGNQSSIQPGAYRSSIGGGYLNVVQSGAYESVIGGGTQNTIQGGAYRATIGGGYGNGVQSNATASVIGGGSGNLAGPWATVPGGFNNSATGEGSFAAGMNAHTSYPGSFVWGDGTQAADGTGSNRFDVLATGGINFFTTGGQVTMVNTTAGVSLGVNTGTPREALDVNGGFMEVEGNGTMGAFGSIASTEVEVGSFNNTITDVSLLNLSSFAYMHLNCSSITIEGGADLAEPFQISDSPGETSKGAVVVIDDLNPGHLKISDQPYDLRVAGVISGANGINPGIQMQQQGLLEGGKNVALTGRVYVQADTSNGPIKPGDLLTTSSLPGRAMRVTDHARAQGAILGKAMTGLSEDKGMVLVLVTLQ